MDTPKLESVPGPLAGAIAVAAVAVAVVEENWAEIVAALGLPR